MALDMATKSRATLAILTGCLARSPRGLIDDETRRHRLMVNYCEHLLIQRQLSRASKRQTVHLLNGLLYGGSGLG
ncbi:MAG TPA: hypothetical protein V6D03_10720 [Candidatus Caenarcaniphilales bacterium]